MSNGRILIVDDSENIRSVLRMNFEYLGYDIRSAGDGEEALRMMAAEPPDVVILDVMMPRQNGFQVCRRIKADPRLADVSVIFLTAKGQREDRYWGRDCGADEYLTKPFSAAELERVIEKLLSRRELNAGGSRPEEEAEVLRTRGEPFSVLTAKFDAKALNVFRQKYGELRYHEAVDAVRETMELIVREEAGEALVWMTGEAAFKALLPGDAERVSALRDRIVVQADLLLESYYDEQDAGRGYVVAKTGDGAREQHVPLLRLEARMSKTGAVGGAAR